MSVIRPARELETIELDLLTEGLRRHYGIDLANYARPALLRRLRQVMDGEGYKTISVLQGEVLHSPEKLESLLAGLGAGPAQLFEEPAFFAAFRKEVVPWLKTHPSIRLWFAGCGAPEEIYALAIVLHEEGLLPRSRIYATDGSASLLAVAQSGRVGWPDSGIGARYSAAGGKHSAGEYLVRQDDEAFVSSALRDRVFFSQHHLVQDGPFNEFHVVICRNTLLHFSHPQQTRIHGLLLESLGRFGYLGIGRKESLRRTPFEKDYDEIAGAGRLFRRVS